VYPTSPLFSALERLVTIQLNDFILNFINIIRQETIPITFFDDEWYITLVKRTNLDLVISPPFEFGRISIKDHFQWGNFVSDFSAVYKKKFKSSTSYFIDIDWCIDFISDVCESEFPLTKLRFEYLLQRFLYFIKQNEEMWDVVPRPIIYNGYVRLLIRLFGFHINPRKLSYWSIPSNLTQLIRENLGPFDQIALILTNESRIKNGWILTLNKSAIHNLKLMNENIFSQFGLAKNEIIFNHLKSQYKSLKAVITIDKPIVSQFWRFLFRIRNSKNPLKLISFLFLLGKLNNEQNFACYPIMPWYAFFKKLGAIKSFRYLNKLLYDFLEF
jgi:hypothetical protein